MATPVGESLFALSWPRARLPEVIEALYGRGAAAGAVPAFASGFSLWLEASAHAVGLRADPLLTPVEDLVELVPRRGVVVVALPGPDRVLVLRRSLAPARPGQPLATFVAPGRWVGCPAAFLQSLDRLAAPPAGDGARRPLDAREGELGLPPEPAARVAAVLARGHGTPPAPLTTWLLDPAGTGFRDWLRRVGAGRLIAVALAGSVGHLLLFLAGWWLVGGSLLQGRVQPAWLWAWVLVLATLVSLRAWAQLAVGELAVYLGALMRERLLEGILHLDLEQVRRHGLGHWFGAVLEVEAMETLARGGGHPAIMSAIQLVMATGLLALAVGWAPALLLGGLGLAGMVLLVAWYWRALEAWTADRLSLTHELCEKILGHRTVLAQLSPEQRHRGEDHALLEYERSGARLHDRLALLQAVAPRGWLVLGLCLLGALLIPGQLAGGPAAIGLGGLLLGYVSFRRLASVTSVLAGAAVALARTREIFQAAARQERPPSIAAAEAVGLPDRGSERPSLVAHRIEFRHAGRSEPVLADSSFEIRRGDRVLVQGPSGSGKSTLAALLTGLRTPSAGVLLYRGIDHHSLGLTAWRQQVALVPQFHENHMMSAPLLFNLLLGRRWPPLIADVKAADEVCRALGLGAVLDKMPAGIAQLVGDSGWQLSQGEQSRVFVARALLQQSDLHVLDEALAAVDGETAAAVLEAILKRVETLVVVHHE